MVFLAKQGGLFQGIPFEESAAMLLLFKKDVAKQVIRNLWCYDPNKNTQMHVNRTTMWIASVHAWLMTVVRCLMDRVKPGGHLWKVHAIIFGRMSEPATK